MLKIKFTGEIEGTELRHIQIECSYNEQSREHTSTNN